MMFKPGSRRTRMMLAKPTKTKEIVHFFFLPCEPNSTRGSFQQAIENNWGNYRGRQQLL